MPIFTLEETPHPFLRGERCYFIAGLFPGWDDLKNFPILVGDFKKSVVSQALANRLGFEVESAQTSRGSIVWESAFEGDLVYHRARLPQIPFGIASPKAGENYIHLSFADLADLFDSYWYSASDDGSPGFVALKPNSESKELCIVVRMERP